jgi:hypothetical protein
MPIDTCWTLKSALLFVAVAGTVFPADPSSPRRG